MVIEGLIRRTVAIIMFVAIALLPLAVGTQAEAADDCQHFTHEHYHFPYAHYDNHRYDGSHFHYDNYHYHHYRNTTHSTPYEKRC